MKQLETLWQLIDGLAERPSGCAVIRFRDDEAESLSWQELSRAVKRFTAALMAAGLRPGETVALQADNSSEWILSCLAILRAGGVVTPLDIQLGTQDLQRILGDSGARFLVTTAALAERLATLALAEPPRVLLLDHTEDPRHWRHLFAAEGPAMPQPAADEPAALFYTSGTSGPPKGVPLTHRNLVFQIERLLETGLVRPTERPLMPLPLHHVYPFVVGMLLPLAAGVPIILPGGLTGRQLIYALRQGRATMFLGVPRLYEALYKGLAERVAASGWLVRLFFRTGMALSTRLGHRLGVHWGRGLLAPFRRGIAPQVRIMASGGAALDPQLARRLDALGWQVGIGYGLTETSPLVTVLQPGELRFQSVGRPLQGVEVRIEPVPEVAGEEQLPAVGEVLVRGAGVFSGYRNLPELTAEAFSSDGWFRTGDLGALDDKGYLTLAGRRSSLIVTPAGKNLQPEELEESYGQSPLIGEVGVLQHDGRLVAVVVPNRAWLPDLDEQARRQIAAAIREVAEGLPSYRRLAGFLLHERPLERTRLGKLQRHRLQALYRELLAAQVTSRKAPARPMAVAQMTAADRLLLQDSKALAVWDLLVRRFGEQPLAPDSRLDTDLGFDSLTWVEMSLRVSEVSGVQLAGETISGLETVRDLLQTVAKAEAARTARLQNPLEAPEAYLDARQQGWAEPLGPVLAILARTAYRLNRWFVTSWFPLQVSGLENVPQQGPFVVAPNHLSALDPPLVAALLKNDLLRQTFWAGWTGISFRNPLLRGLSRLAQTVPIDPDAAPIQSLALGALVLKRGKNLIWFPEGRRSTSGELLPFLPGLGLLLSHFRVPVVPVAIEGTGQALPKGRLWPKRRPLRVSFGVPLTCAELLAAGQGDLPPEKITHALHERVALLKAELAAGSGRSGSD